MRPKSRNELRVIISQLNDYLKSHDDLLYFERLCLEKSIRLMISADYHLGHLGISHSVAKSLESHDSEI